MKRSVSNPELKGIKKSYSILKHNFDPNDKSIHVYLCDTSVESYVNKEVAVSKKDFDGFVFALECVGYRNVTDIPRIVYVEV